MLTRFCLLLLQSSTRPLVCRPGGTKTWIQPSAALPRWILFHDKSVHFLPIFGHTETCFQGITNIIRYSLSLSHAVGARRQIHYTLTPVGQNPSHTHLYPLPEGRTPLQDAFDCSSCGTNQVKNPFSQLFSVNFTFTRKAMITRDDSTTLTTRFVNLTL